MINHEKKLIKLIREEYTHRLVQILKENVTELVETEMFDIQGNQLLSPGLKVRHKKSGYEYTIDHIEGDDDDATVFLRHPEAARFKVPEVNTHLVEGDDELLKVNLDGIDLEKAMGADEIAPEAPQQVSTQPVDPGSLLRINKKEFEKEYEVK